MFLNRVSSSGVQLLRVKHQRRDLSDLTIFGVDTVDAVRVADAVDTDAVDATDADAVDAVDADTVDTADTVVEGGRSVAAGLRCRRLMRLMRLFREDAQSPLGLDARGMGIVREEQRTEVTSGRTCPI